MKRLKPRNETRLEGVCCDLFQTEMEAKWALDSAESFLKEIGMPVPRDEVYDTTVDLRNALQKDKPVTECERPGELFGFLGVVPSYLVPLWRIFSEIDDLWVTGDPVKDADGIKKVIELARKDLYAQEMMLVQVLKSLAR